MHAAGRNFRLFLSLTILGGAHLAQAQEPAADEPVRLVSRNTEAEAIDDAQLVKLRYRMQEGETINTRVTHLAKTLTKVQDEEQASQSRTVSTKRWKVVGVDSDGNMTFEHSVHQVDASQQVGSRDEIRYNSDGEEVPRQFETVDEKVDQVISTVTIKPNGDVLERSTDDRYGRLGLGEIAIRFPEDAIAVGDQWESTREIQVRRPDKTPMRVKVREVFTLEKVSAGVAFIKVRNEALTPIRTPEIEAQVMQQLNNGTIRFDVDAGRLLAKEIAWDSTVIGVSGPGSRLEYSARLEEELLD